MSADTQPAGRSHISYVCDRCGMPAVKRGGRWEHAEAADEVFCRVVMRGDLPPGRPCCDHCNNLDGDPDGHDYGDESAHDGPCAECADDD